MYCWTAQWWHLAEVMRIHNALRIMRQEVAYPNKQKLGLGLYERLFPLN